MPKVKGLTQETIYSTTPQPINDKPDKRGNHSKEPRYPKDENGVRRPSEKQLAHQQKFKDLRSYDRDKDVASIIGAFAEIASKPRIDTRNAEEVEDAIIDYLKVCAERNIKPTVEGMATALGTNRVSLWKWENGEIKRPQEVIDVVTYYKSVINALHIQYMEENKINPVSGIFIAKNNFANYRDQQEVRYNIEVSPMKSTTQLADKYVETMAIDITDDVEDVP